MPCLVHNSGQLFNVSAESYQQLYNILHKTVMYIGPWVDS